MWSTHQQSEREFQTNGQAANAGRGLKLVCLVLVTSLCACSAVDPAADDVAKPTDDKADTGQKICVELGQPATCDPCDAAGWYNDGECDTFCKTPDPDCSASSEVATFLARNTYTTAWGVPEEHPDGFGDYIATHTMVATTLSQGNANAWAKHYAPMIGTGLGLHFTFQAREAPGAPLIKVRNATDANGDCLPVTPRPQSNNDYSEVNVFTWAGGVAHPVACSTAGSVLVHFGPGYTNTYTFNVQFNDGSAWIDRQISVTMD